MYSFVVRLWRFLRSIEKISGLYDYWESRDRVTNIIDRKIDTILEGTVRLGSTEGPGVYICDELGGSEELCVPCGEERESGLFLVGRIGRMMCSLWGGSGE